MAESRDGESIEPIQAIERRQDEVLRQLDLLEERIAALLADYTANPVAVRKAA